MARIVLDQVNKIYPGGVKGIDGLSLQICDGEFMVLVGPSGCGKSTALRSVPGLEEISSGTISIGDRMVNDLPPKDRDIAMVFQNYALYPHMTVEKNLAFGLEQRKTPKPRFSAGSPRWPGCWAWMTICSASRPRCPAGSGSGSRWAARSSGSRRRS